MKIYRGEQFPLPLHITTASFDITAISTVDFEVGGVEKSYPSEVTYDSTAKTFYFPLEEDDTESFDDVVAVGGMFNYSNGTKRWVTFGDVQVRDGRT